LISAPRPNAKALHETDLYYLRERSTGNLGLTRLIACNIYEWYIFDAAEFRSLFLQRQGGWSGNSTTGRSNRLSSARTDAFYGEIVAAPFWRDPTSELVCTHIDLRPCEAFAEAHGRRGREAPPPLQTLSPPHLLKLPFANDSNTLNREFYNELLHIIGLEEIREGGRKLIRRNRTGKGMKAPCWKTRSTS